jgi:aminoglycoside phosphotransferase (APT) family kinase protein
MSERAPPGVPRLERWTPPDFSRLDAVAAALAEACPDAAPVAPLRLLGEGFFSVALATASGVVFRLGTSPDVYARHEKEWRLLPWLAQRGLPTAIPSPLWLLPPGNAFPFGGIGYSMLVGHSLSEELFARGDRAALAEQIAAFTLAMHRLPAEEARALGVPPDPERLWNEAYRDVSLTALPELLTAAELMRLERWWEEFLADERMTAYAPVLVQGDMNHENLLVDETASKLLGVLDFEHATVGDPAHDFRHLHFLDTELLDAVLGAYRSLGGELDEGITYRFERYRQLSSFSGVLRAWGRGEREPIKRAPERLRRLGVI